MSRETRLRLLLGVFVALLVTMNVLGAKLTTFFGVVVSVSIFMVPATFLITDIVAEVEGRSVAREFVFIGTIGLTLLMLLTWVSLQFRPAERFLYDREFGIVFSSSLRFVAASIIAFFLSQFHDVWAFEWWRRRTGGKHLWLRNNASTMVSQAVDTLVFMMIAFYGAAPGYTFGFILELALPYYLFKIGFAVIDTPLVYAGARWLRGNMTGRIPAVAAVVGCLLLAAGAVSAQTDQEAQGPTVHVSGLAGVYALGSDTDRNVRFYGVGASWLVGQATWLGVEIDLLRVPRDRTHIVTPGGDRTSYETQPIVFAGATFMMPAGRVRPMGRLLLGNGGGDGDGVARAAALGVDVGLVGGAGLRLEGRAYQGLFETPFSTTVVGFAASFVWLSSH